MKKIDVIVIIIRYNPCDSPIVKLFPQATLDVIQRCHDEFMKMSPTRTGSVEYTINSESGDISLVKNRTASIFQP